MSKTLTIKDRSRFNVLCKRIKVWFDDRFAVGAALAEIRDSRLYRDDYETFETFCAGEYGIKRDQAYRMIDASSVRKSLENNKGLSEISDKIQNESQAIALKAVPMAKRAKVVEIAAKTGRVTAKSLLDAAKRVISTDKNGAEEGEVVVRDTTGYIVPPRALPYWNRKGEIEELLHHISVARSALRKFLPNGEGETNDLMFCESNLNGVVADLNSAYTGLEVSRPYAVCPTCQGQTVHNCMLCKGRGVVSKFRFKTVPEELIAIRAKSCKK